MEPKYYKTEYIYCKVLEENKPFWVFGLCGWWEGSEISWEQYEKRLTELKIPYWEVSQLEVLVVLGLT